MLVEKVEDFFGPRPMLLAHVVSSKNAFSDLKVATKGRWKFVLERLFSSGFIKN